MRFRFDLFHFLVLNTRMRHPSLRGTAFTIAFASTLVLAAGAACVLVSQGLSPRAREIIAGLALHRFWFSYPEAPAKGIPVPFFILGALISVSLFASFASLRARALYARSPSPALLFFIVYLFSLCVESLRGLALYLYATGSAVRLIAPISRIVVGGRFAGQLSLLLTALAMLEMKYRKRFMLIGILLLMSLAIAAYIPMDNTSLLASLTYRLGDEQGAWFAELALGAIIIGGMCAAGFIKRKSWFYAMAGASLALTAGRQILSFTPPLPVIAGGPLLIAAGIIVFLTALRRVYAEEANA
jgi:hypothetical protein